ncbi:hypothetical protein BDY19DRAFT_526787 [Irpex rosettiformis]|uniref:Uncharacterized protein n=1 Tax=Irpex rosettiformis TaxID=378272 RepID=A0ACB8TRB5_9APHY|nr:hypothetical protein BDY19DRAFT_526787 [Irpex rosettiformis]
MGVKLVAMSELLFYNKFLDATRPALKGHVNIRSRMALRNSDHCFFARSTLIQPHRMSAYLPLSQPSSNKQRMADSGLRQDPDVWMSDGNVVITAKDKEGVTWGFKCHKSLLSRHSRMFEGMFTLSQPQDAETYEGLPLVTLTDPYADFKALLQMLYDPMEYLPKVSDLSPLDWPEELRAISGPLRLSNKYEFDTLHASLTKVLESRWPVTLEGWDKIVQRIRDAQVEASEEGVECPLVNPASLILLAEEANVPSVLPAAYYNLYTQWKNSYRLEGHTWKEVCEESHFAVDLTGFTLEHHLRMAEGSDFLRTAITQLWGFILPTIFQCRREECRRDTKKWISEQFVQYMTSQELFYDPLDTLAKIKQPIPRLEFSKEYGICIGCLDQLENAMDACRDYIWEDFPYLFKLKARESGKMYGFLLNLDDIRCRYDQPIIML